MHLASFSGGILVGVLAMQFAGAGGSAPAASSALTSSVASPAALPSVAASPAANEVPAATSGETRITSPAVPEISPTAETRRTSPAAGYRGGLRIDSRPAGAAVFVNNQQVGHTPIVLRSLQAGSRAVRVQLGGYAPWSRSVRVVANQQSTVLAQLEPAR